MEKTSLQNDIVQHTVNSSGEKSISQPDTMRCQVASFFLTLTGREELSECGPWGRQSRTSVLLDSQHGHRKATWL